MAQLAAVTGMAGGDGGGDGGRFGGSVGGAGVDGGDGVITASRDSTRARRLLNEIPLTKTSLLVETVPEQVTVPAESTVMGEESVPPGVAATWNARVPAEESVI